MKHLGDVEALRRSAAADICGFLRSLPPFEHRCPNFEVSFWLVCMTFFT